MSLILTKKHSKQQVNLLKALEDGRYIEMAMIGEEYSVVDDITKKHLKISYYPDRAIILLSAAKMNILMS
ncbi:hypothetical protein [Gallibacterium anatis]|uniref:hypothetical protein n=1 Tax=Gallibacterium anatis TaxID=750 RepID=UPI00057FAF6E|nr:hypothetical protein [Gallibacterium anatis]